MTNTLDTLIEELSNRVQKADSSPTTLNGSRGVWRTVRGFRLFIALEGTKLGEVLSGPPAFKGRTFDDITATGWGSLTPKETEDFIRGINVSPKGIKNLKTAIRTKVTEKHPNDSRGRDVEELSNVKELVPMARSAQFSDEEIKVLLENKVKTFPRRLPAVDGNKGEETSTRQLRGYTKPAETNNEEHTLEGALALLTKPVVGEDSKTERVSEAILEASKNLKDEVAARRLEKLSYQLRAKDVNIGEAKTQIKEIIEGKNKLAAPTKKELAAIHDKAVVQEFLKTADTKIKTLAEGKLKNVPNAESAATKEVIAELVKVVKNPQVKQRLLSIQDSKRLTTQGMNFRVLQLLRFILTLGTV